MAADSRRCREAHLDLTAATLPTAASEVRLHLESAGLVSRLFRVERRLHAHAGSELLRQNTFLSAHEGSRNRETRVLLRRARAAKPARLERDSQKSHQRAEVEIPPCVHDVLGGLLALRTLRLEPGQNGQLPVSDGKKFVQVKVESQLREEIKTDLGTLSKQSATKYSSLTTSFIKRSGHLHVWLTDDERRLPVQLQVRLQFTIGTITFRLQKEEKS